jgi:hypothetical protein
LEIGENFGKKSEGKFWKNFGKIRRKNLRENFEKNPKKKIWEKFAGGFFGRVLQKKLLQNLGRLVWSMGVVLEVRKEE